MRKLIICSLSIFFLFYNLKAQINIPDLKLSEKHYSLLNTSNLKNLEVQPKKRKANNIYIGAGYSFVIFTASELNSTYPVFNTRAGDFLSEVNLYFGYAIARAVTLEFEPSILFTHNDKILTFQFTPPIHQNDTTFQFVQSGNPGLLALPLALNVRFFPLYKQTNSFIRLFFIGGGIGAVWIREEYDNIYYDIDSTTGNPYPQYFVSGETTSQWTPLFRIMTGFTGTGGQFGFGGELRYNIIPLKEEAIPFVTRTAPNFNSVDITLRFYFSL